MRKRTLEEKTIDYLLDENQEGIVEGNIYIRVKIPIQEKSIDQQNEVLRLAQNIEVVHKYEKAKNINGELASRKIPFQIDKVEFEREDD